MVNKKVYYDARSINPNQGDMVEVVVQHHEQPAETLTALYMGSVQMEAYTTPYFKFLVEGNQVRLISANAVREWRFKIDVPNVGALPAIEAEADADNQRYEPSYRRY